MGLAPKCVRVCVCACVPPQSYRELVSANAATEAVSRLLAVKQEEARLAEADAQRAAEQLARHGSSKHVHSAGHDS